MAIALVNSAAGTFASGSSTTIAAPTTSLTTGNCILVAIRSGASGSIVSSIADTATNTYRFLGWILGGGTVGNTTNLELWYALNVTGNASNVVTATFTASASNRSICTAQYSGVATVAPIDQLSYGFAASATTVTDKAITTTVADELLFAACQVDATGGTWTPSTGFSTVTQDSSNVVYLQHDIVSSLQSGLAITAATGASVNHYIIVATLHGTIGGGSSTTGFGAA